MNNDEKLYGYIQSNLSSSIKKIYGVSTDEACKELFELIKVPLEKTLSSIAGYKINPQGNAQSVAKNYLSTLSADIIKRIGAVMGKTEAEIAQTLTQQTRKGSNADFYETRLNRLKEKLIGKKIRCLGKNLPIEYERSLSLWFNPAKRYPVGIYTIADIVHYKDKSYTIIPKNDTPEQSEMIIRPLRSGWEQVRGQDSINPETIASYRFDDVVKQGLIVPQEVKAEYDQWILDQKKEAEKHMIENKQKLERYKGKNIYVLHQYNSTKTPVGAYTIEDFIDPETYTEKPVKNRISLYYFETLVDKGRYVLNDYNEFEMYYVSTPEKEEERKAYESKKDMSRIITAQFIHPNKKDNIGNLNFYILSYIQTQDQRFLDFFNTRNGSHIPVEKIQSMIAQYTAASADDKNTLQHSSENRAKTMQTLKEKTQNIGKYLADIQSDIKYLSREKQSEFFIDKDMRLEKSSVAPENAYFPNLPWPTSPQKSMSETRKKIALFYDRLDDDTKLFLRSIGVFRGDADAKGLRMQERNSANKIGVEANYKEFLKFDLGKKYAEFKEKNDAYICDGLVDLFQKLVENITTMQQLTKELNSTMIEPELAYKNTYEIDETTDPQAKAFSLLKKEIPALNLIERTDRSVKKAGEEISADMLQQLKNKFTS